MTKGGEKPRVLLVEDDLRLAESLMGLLEMAEGVEIIHKADAVMALKALAEGSFEMVVTDYALGKGVNGDAVLKAAKELQPKAKRLMMSGSKSAEWVVEAGLADAFYLKEGGLAGVLLDEVEALGKQARTL